MPQDDESRKEPPNNSASSTTSSGGSANESRRPLRFSALMDSLLDQVREGSLPDEQGKERVVHGITLGQLLETTAHSGFGFLIGLLAVVAIPFIGVSTPFGIAIGGLGVQMAVRRHTPWLPKFLARREIPYRILVRVSDLLSRWGERLEKWVRPRLTVMTQGPSWSLIGVMIVILGFGLALPIPIPASNLIFIIPMVIYGLAILEEDGVLAIVGHACTLALVALGFAFSNLLVKSWEKFFG